MKFPTLRIISGQFKGRPLAAPQSAATHPMGAREKNALFNMINPAGLVVLDAYAGTGALGIEAISRGAREVVFVENHPDALKTLHANLDRLKKETSQGLNFQVFGQSVARFCQTSTYVGAFNLILADPPYDQINPNELTLLVPLLAPNGHFVLSSPADQPPLDLSGLTLVSTHTYARARVTVYQA